MILGCEEDWRVLFEVAEHTGVWYTTFSMAELGDAEKIQQE
jgi:hypothetical protein